MRTRLRIYSVILALLLWPGLLLHAANPIVASLGSTGPAPTMDGTEGGGEWAGASPAINVASTSPLHGSLRVLHRADGLYFIAIIADNSINDNDQFNLRFDIDHSRGAIDGDDFGVVIRRGGTANWGPANADPATWAAVPGVNFGVTSAPTQWIAEFHLPIGAPSGLSIPASSTCLPSKASCIGFYFNFYDVDNAFGTPSAKYAQFPTPAGDTLIDGDPSQWADLLFDPATTFPNLQVLDVRTLNADPYKINYAGVNSFEVQIRNPGGTVFPNASNVRINLYMGALGIGEPWHRLDTNGILTADCNGAAAAWNSLVLPTKTDVCNGTAPGSAPLPDISTLTTTAVADNTAKYTIQNGLTMARTGSSDNLTINAGPATFYPTLDWNTTPAQDNFFQLINDSMGHPKNRQHECVMAEVLFPNDPNNGDNTIQRNLDFFGTPGTMLIKRIFSLGPFAFGKYDPNVGKKMFLQVSRQNMDQSFQFKLEGLQQLPNDTYVAELKGTNSLSVTADITAPSATSLGKTIKENLMVPARAGEELGEKHHWWCPFHRASDNPVNVNVTPGSVLWIVNYSLNANDVQTVDVDGSGPLPDAGPFGLPQSAAPGRTPLLVPSARIGELVLSFDDFKTGVGIGNGVEVRVPAGANHLSLAINDSHKGYDGHKGTGFRVKIVERAAASASVQPTSRRETAAMRVPSNSFLSAQVASQGPGETRGIRVVPIDNLLPQACVSGYEDSGTKRTIGGQPTEMYRYIGNVCFVIRAITADQQPRLESGDKVVR
jgi:hypothetical protein